ncbi:hypothetical protein Bbelb_322560 [Branchiostoma belcheri]|nr:hypothetical protein Bbelb_322560 [Branchiostoma belcheri]
MEATNVITSTPELSESEPDKTQDLALQNEDRLASDDSVCVTQQGQMVQQDVADLLPDDWETNEPLSDGTEKAEVVVRRKQVKVKTPSNVQSDTVDSGLSERGPPVDPVLTARCQSGQQQTEQTLNAKFQQNASIGARSLDMIQFAMEERSSRPPRDGRSEHSSMPTSSTDFDHILVHADEIRQFVAFQAITLKGEILYYESNNFPELEIAKKKLHLTKISKLHEESKVFIANMETTFDSIWRSTTESESNPTTQSESNYVSSTNTASCQDDTIAGPSLEATTNRGIPDGQLKASTAEKQVSKHDQLQNEVKSGNDAEDSAAASNVKTGSEQARASFPTTSDSTSMPNLQNAVKNKQLTVDQNIVAEDPKSKMGPKSDTKNQEASEQSSLLEPGSSGDASRNDTVPSDSSYPMPCSNGLGLHIEAINEAISNHAHRTLGQREQFQFHADLPPEQTAVPPECDHDGHADRNQCRDTDPWIRRKGSSKTASQKSYNELHFGQPPGPTKVAGTPKENKGDNPSEIEQHSNSSQKSVELGTTTSQAGPSTEEDQELEGAVGGMTHPPHDAKEDVIIEVTNRPDANDRPIGKVQGMRRCQSLTDELVSEGEENPRLTSFEDPDDAHLYLSQEEELRVPDVRDRFRDEQPHGLHNNFLLPPPETTESDMASRPTDTPRPGPTPHNTSLKQAVGSSEGRVLERSLSAMTFQRGRSTTMSSRGRPKKKNQSADRANTARCYSCPPVCFVQPYKDHEEGPASSNSLSSDCNPLVQADNRQVAGTCQQNNCQAGPKITVLDNAQQLLGVIRTSPTPVEQIAYSIRERVFQELVLTAFTLKYPDGDVIPEGTLLGDQDVTVIVFPAETDQPGQWRAAVLMTPVLPPGTAGDKKNLFVIPPEVVLRYVDPASWAVDVISHCWACDAGSQWAGGFVLGQTGVQSGYESSPSGTCDISDLYGMAAVCETDFICHSQQYDCSSRYETLLYCVTGIVWNCFRGMMTDEELVVKAATVQMMFKTSRSQEFYCSGRIWTHLDVGRYLAEHDGACTPAFYDEKDECFSSVSPTLNSGQFLDPLLCSNYSIALECTREAMRKNCRFSGEKRNVSVGHNPFCDCEDVLSTTVKSDSFTTKPNMLPTDTSTDVTTTETLDNKTLVMQTYEPPLDNPIERVEDIDKDTVSNKAQDLLALSMVCIAVVISVTLLLIHIS